jgi:DNA repair photolyase
MNAKLARQLEPRAPRPDLRMRTVSELRAAGIRAGVGCSPLMPGITDSASSIRAVARAASAAGASFLASGALFLKPCSLPTFLGFVREHFPEQLEAYKRRYAGSAFVSSAYRERMAALVDQICREFKLGRRHMMEDAAKEPAPQIIEIQPWLPFAAGTSERCGYDASA